MKAPGFDRDSYAITRHDHDDCYLLLDEIKYCTLLPDGKARLIRVHSGMETDLGSIPRPLQYLVAKDDLHFFYPFMVHDWLYRHRPDWCGSRHIADGILNEAAAVRGAPLWRRMLVRVGLFVGGWLAWQNAAKKRAKA